MLGLAAIASLSLTMPTQRYHVSLSRRAVLFSAASAATSMPLAASSANDAAKASQQLMDSSAALDQLLQQYDTICAADGGNGVRRILGKLGPTSPLHRVDKAVNLVARDLDDDKVFDLVDKFLGQLDAADGDAYSSIFVPPGGGTTPEFWLEKSKKEVAGARATLGAILELQ